MILKGQGMGLWCSAKGLLLFFLHLLIFLVLSFEQVKLLLLHLANALGQAGDLSPPRGADYSPHLIFKTAAANLAVEQRLLIRNTCRGFLNLRLDNSSMLLHLPGLICQGMLELAGDFLSCKLLSEFYTCRGRKMVPGLTLCFC